MTIERVGGASVGYGPCFLCGHQVTFKFANGKKKSHWINYVCPVPADGGCGCQVFARADKSDGIMVKRIKSWTTAAMRACCLGKSEPEPETAQEPSPEPESRTKPEIEIPDEPVSPVNFWDRKI